MILKFESNDLHNGNSTIVETPFDFQYLSGKTFDESFQKLVELYTKQIENTGHGPNCLWKNFETPIEEVYHLRQYLPNTNQF